MLVFRRLVRRLADYIVERINKVRDLFPSRYWAPFLVITQIHNIFTNEYVVDPWGTFKLVYSPFPRWKYAVPPPLSVEVLSDGGYDFFYDRHPNIIPLRTTVVWRMRDTPLRALYRIYDAVCGENEIEIRHESRYIWARHEWRLCDFPDPHDPDPVRYALLAGIMEDLVRAFNIRLSDMWPRDSRIHLDRRWYMNRDSRTPQPLESVPAWTAGVPAAPERIVLWRELQYSEDIFEAFTSENCKRRNIWASTGALIFL